MRARPWNRDSPSGSFDVIVIGSGMGGMVCAALLAKAGRRVLVLEQHYVPGGFTHTFSRKGYTWDVGVHAVGEVTRQGLPGRLLHALTDGALEWASLGPAYDEFHFPDLHISFPDNPTQFTENLLQAFPREEASIATYLKLVRDVSRDMRGLMASRLLPRSLEMLSKPLLSSSARSLFARTTAEVVGELTSDQKLGALLTAQWGYYGSPPQRSAFAMHALVVKHFLWGGYYPVGGSAHLATTLLGTVAKAGGWTRVVCDVQDILLEDGRAVGVRLKSGEVIRAPAIVSAAGVRPTVERLLPPDVQKATWATSVKSLDPAPAHVCLYLGFRGDIREAGASSANQWFYETWTHDLDAWPVTAGANPPPSPVLYVSFPSLKDPTIAAQVSTRHTAEVVTFVRYQDFEPWKALRWKRRGQDYEAFKEALQNAMLEQFLARFPKLRSMVDYVELSTPLSTEHFIRPVSGSIYGLEPTPRRFANSWLRPRSPIPGLFFAGADMTSVGVIGAMMGGVMAALATAPLDVGRYLAGERLVRR